MFSWGISRFGTKERRQMHLKKFRCLIHVLKMMTVLANVLVQSYCNSVVLTPGSVTLNYLQPTTFNNLVIESSLVYSEDGIIVISISIYIQSSPSSRGHHYYQYHHHCMRYNNKIISWFCYCKHGNVHATFIFTLFKLIVFAAKIKTPKYHEYAYTLIHVCICGTKV